MFLGDGDLVDVLVVMLFLFIYGCVVCCCVLGMFKMMDEFGVDVKLVVVFVNKLSLVMVYMIDLLDIG